MKEQLVHQDRWQKMNTRTDEGTAGTPGQMTENEHQDWWRNSWYTRTDDRKWTPGLMQEQLVHENRWQKMNTRTDAGTAGTREQMTENEHQDWWRNSWYTRTDDRKWTPGLMKEQLVHQDRLQNNGGTRTDDRKHRRDTIADDRGNRRSTRTGDSRNRRNTRTNDRETVETARQGTQKGEGTKKHCMKFNSRVSNQGLCILLEQMIQRTYNKQGAWLGPCDCSQHIQWTHPLLADHTGMLFVQLK